MLLLSSTAEMPRFVAHDQIECQKPLCQRNMTAMQNCSGCHTDLLVAMTTFIFSICEQPTMHSFAGWAYKAVWPTFFRKIFVEGFLATELGYERRKSQFVFEWHNVIPPFSRFLITFYHFNSPIVRPLSNLTQRDNHIKFFYYR